MYKTEKRFAEVEERILITEPYGNENEYAKGDVLTVYQTEGVHPDDEDSQPFELDTSLGDVYCKGVRMFIEGCEYEVIVGEEPNATEVQDRKGE